MAYGVLDGAERQQPAIRAASHHCEWNPRQVNDGTCDRAVRRFRVADDCAAECRLFESRAYHVEPGVSTFSQVDVGTRVCATANEELSIYVSVDGQLPGTDPSLASPAPQARVRSIDRSYRLLGIQRIGGDVETFKVDPMVPLERMQAGDYVRIAPLDLVSFSKCREKR